MRKDIALGVLSGLILQFLPLHAASSVILAEGKTKIVRSCPGNPDLAIFEAKDDITGGDGARHDVITGKAEIATETTCNVFRLLADCDIPLAFREQIDARSFQAVLCDMIEYEVVVRREAHGSYLKRHPELKKGTVFPKLIVEFFLKTSQKQWKGTPIPKDDPFIQFSKEGALLYLPHIPMETQTPFMVLKDFPCREKPHLLEEMSMIAREVFLILEKAWELQEGRLVDFKVEFGIDSKGNLLLADVIDNDSWRVVQQDSYIDKQIYREGGTLDEVTRLYEKVRRLTRSFKLPRQHLIIWNDSGALDPFFQQIVPTDHGNLKVSQATSAESMEKLIQEIPDHVIVKNNPESLFDGIQILAAKNPLLYMLLKFQQIEYGY